MYVSIYITSQSIWSCTPACFIFPSLACPPLKLPPFTAPYQGILKLIQCPSLHRLLQSVFKQAATPNSIIWSDKLLHETLYLCAVMLAEEDPNHPGSLTNAAISGSQSKLFQASFEYRAFYGSQSLLLHCRLPLNIEHSMAVRVCSCTAGFL